jgi:hypothetical protein
MSGSIIAQDQGSSVEALLKPTAQHWLITMFKHNEYRVITPLDTDNYAIHEEFMHLFPQPEYYVFHNRLDPECPENSVPVLLDTKNALCRATVTYNTCFDACFVFWRFSYDILKGKKLYLSSLLTSDARTDEEY